MVKSLRIFVGSYCGVIRMNSEIRRSGSVIHVCNSSTRQKDYEFESSLGYKTRLRLNNIFFKKQNHRLVNGKSPYNG